MDKAAAKLLMIIQEEKKSLENELIGDKNKPLTTPTRYNHLDERLTPEGQELLGRLNTAVGKVLNVAGQKDLIFPRKMQALRHLKAASEILGGANRSSLPGSLEEENDQVGNLFMTIERLVDQLRDLNNQGLSDSEKNTLKLYTFKTIIPAVRKLLRGGVYEFERGDRMANVLAMEEIELAVAEEVSKTLAEGEENES